jgi:lysozyme
MWLTLAVSTRWNQLVSKIPWVLDQPETVQRALGNMAYQMGVNGVLNFAKMIAALKVGDRALAAKEAEDSTWFRQTPKRARRVITFLRNGA